MVKNAFVGVVFGLRRSYTHIEVAQTRQKTIWVPYRRIEPAKDLVEKHAGSVHPHRVGRKECGQVCAHI